MSYDSKLAAAIARHCRSKTTPERPVAGLSLYHVQTSLPRQPKMYTPTICIVAQGRKQIYFGDQTRSYDPDNYLINSIPLPLEAEIQGVTPATPYLGLSLEIESYMVSQLLIEMGEQAGNNQPTEEIIVSTTISERLNDCIIRLLDCLDSPLDIKILVPALKREIFYEVLRGPYGHVLKNCVANHNGANRIAPVVNFIEQNFHLPLDVETIARHAGMSSSSLHDHFKQATSMSPMQFVKSLRLHRAHSLLLSGNQAGEASYQVGYNSPSQFSREFKRFFGESPRNIQSPTGKF